MVTGTGLGAVETLVTMSNIKGGDWESGCTGGNAKVNTAGTDCLGYGVLDFGKYDPGQVPVSLDSIVGAGGTAADLALVFNPNETGNEVGGPSLNLLRIALGIYDSTGTLVDVFTFAPDNGIILKSAGVGSSGFYQFVVTGSTAANYQFGEGYMIGAAFYADLVNDGHDTVYVVKNGATTSVPEPATMLLLGTGLIGLGSVARHRMRK
jgi:hypothetical protein